MFKELVKTDFQLRYQGSLLGIIWSVLKPLMLFAVMYAIFVQFLKFSDGTPTFAISLLCGTCLWSFFTEATTMGMTAIVNRGDLLRKIRFPRTILVAAATTNALISLGINLVVVLIFAVFGPGQVTWRILLVPFSLVQLYMLALGLSLLFCTLFVYFRDILHIWEVLMQAIFYATPIIYPLSMVQKSFPQIAQYMLLNPVAQIIMDIRHNLLAPDYVPTVWQVVPNGYVAIIPYLLTAGVFALGVSVFSKHNPHFPEIL